MRKQIQAINESKDFGIEDIEQHFNEYFESTLGAVSVEPRDAAEGRRGMSVDYDLRFDSKITPKELESSILKEIQSKFKPSVKGFSVVLVRNLEMKEYPSPFNKDFKDRVFSFSIVIKKSTQDEFEDKTSGKW